LEPVSGEADRIREGKMGTGARFKGNGKKRDVRETACSPHDP